MMLKRWCAFGTAGVYGFRALRFAEPRNDSYGMYCPPLTSMICPVTYPLIISEAR